MDGLMKNYLKWSVRMQRRSATTRLIVGASFVLQETVGLFSDHELGAARLALGTAAIRVAS